jgi:hypothetical protein
MIDVFVEAGAKKVFASAVEWPGWARSGRDEDASLEALAEYQTRYRKALGPLAKSLKGATFAVVERAKGDSTTDFGAPGRIPKADLAPAGAKELARLVAILEACWRAFDEAAKGAGRRKLATGPRGGGRDVQKMRAHVHEADRAYLSALGGKHKPSGKPFATESTAMRAAFVEALRLREQGALPEHGPRGGTRWPARYAVRRSAWHALDHAWEIEDRLVR